MSTATMPGVVRHDATVISLVGFAHGTSHFFHLMLPPLFPWLMSEYSLSYTQVGGITSVFFVTSGVGQALAGFFVDRWGAHRVLCLGVSLLAFSGILLAAAPDWWGLYVAAFVAGLGNSVFHPADFALLNHRVSQPRLGHAFSVHGLSGNLGWAVSPLVMTVAATAFGWRVAGLAAALLGVMSLSMLWWKRVDLTDHVSVHERSGKKQPGKGVSHLLRLRLTWVAFSFFFFATFGFGALQNFAPSLLRDLYGLSLTVATSALTAYLIGGAAGLVIGGFFANASAGQEKLVGLAFLVSAAMAVVVALVIVPGWTVLAVMALMGFGIGMASPSRDMLVRKSTVAKLGTGAFGRMYGLVYSGADVGLATAPLLFGILMDAGWGRLVFVGVSISLVIAVIAAGAIAREASMKV
jgi:FSR family fosmidomycin resistance protein-like MFS transporter